MSEDKPVTPKIDGYGTWSGDKSKPMSRRDFLRTVGESAGALTVLSQPGANELANLANMVNDKNNTVDRGELNLPESIDIYLKRYLGGSYEVVGRQSFVADLVEKGVVSIGDTHNAPEDIDYIWGVVEEIKENTDRPIVLAFERFEAGRDGAFLEAINSSDEQDLENSLQALFAESDYSRKWGRNADAKFPSIERFEQLISDSARSGIRMIGLEVERPESEFVSDEVRNPGWVDNLESFLNEHYFDSSTRPLVIAVGGGRHMNAQEGSFANLVSESERIKELGGVVSVVLPFAVENFGISSEQREVMGLTDELIVKRGAPAVVPENTPAYDVSKYTAVKDYWVAMNPQISEFYSKDN